MRSLVLAISMWAACMPDPGFAQQGVPPAPIGHRQPTAADVPGNDSSAGGTVAAPEFGPSPADRKIDKSLNICPNC